VGSISSEKIISALDVESFKEAEKFVKLLKHTIGVFKVGKQLFTNCGPKVVEMIQQHGGKVFLDLKFHDIPHTVACAVEEALHAMGGQKMMQEAVHASIKQAQGPSYPPPILLAVTILTSLRQEDLEGIGIVSSMEEAVLRLAKLSKHAGVHGVIASAREAALIRANCGDDFIIVTPGIRPKGVALDDQKRAVTPGEAIIAGSDYIVIGRPILEAKDPLKVANEIVEELRKVSA